MMPSFMELGRSLTCWNVPNIVSSSARWIQYISLRTILMLSSHQRLDLRSSVFLSGFVIKSVCISHLCHTYNNTCFSHPSWFDTHRISIVAIRLTTPTSISNYVNWYSVMLRVYILCNYGILFLCSQDLCTLRLHLLHCADDNILVMACFLLRPEVSIYPRKGPPVCKYTCFLWVGSLVGLGYL